MITATDRNELKMISTAGNELICDNSWMAVDELM